MGFTDAYIDSAQFRAKLSAYWRMRHTDDIPLQAVK
jgi:hypothetical protein